MLEVIGQPMYFANADRTPDHAILNNKKSASNVTG